STCRDEVHHACRRGARTRGSTFAPPDDMPPIARLEPAAYRIPTETPEADGTYEWTATTLVTVHVTAGDRRGFGYTYGSAAVVPLVRDQLAPRLVGADALAIEGAWNLA